MLNEQKNGQPHSCLRSPAIGETFVKFDERIKAMTASITSRNAVEFMLYSKTYATLLDIKVASSVFTRAQNHRVRIQKSKSINRRT